MGTNKFSKDIFPWHVGEFNDVIIDTSDDTVILKPGESIGDYTTIIYTDVGDKVSISWEADETFGSINSIAGASPKTIQIRTSDTKPIDNSVVIGISDLDPIYNLGMTNSGTTWVAIPTATYLIDTVRSVGSGMAIALGYPLQNTFTDNMYMHLFSNLVLTKGKFELVDSPNDTFNTLGSGLALTRGNVYNTIPTPDNMYIHAASVLIITKS